MNPIVNAVSGRLSLRAPLTRSLEILAEVAEMFPLRKDTDPAVALGAIRERFPSMESFERDFPSLCFAIATGVGKTRLMGAFISYLYLSKGIRHFFVLAPNLTIYNKLITDFKPNTPKYVFKGIGEFAAEPPDIITGDNYEGASSVMRSRMLQCQINVFNISKINSEVRGGRSPRIKRLSEYIGQSYFEYLSGLDDLVLLMDESHRYRGSAGIKAINELRPVLGLELTATPQVESSRGPIPFKNIIYSYPLGQAMKDGFVKEPAAATRQDLDKRNLTPDALERLKLEDGIRVHQDTKVQLDLYAAQNERAAVKPFVLVIARDVEHAQGLVQTISADDFFKGHYKDKVIIVHSGLSGEEEENNVRRLLAVEDPKEPTEIVVHVNMLKEGWDVTNLYTIVPLRAANARTLVEQSIGRGLRLPYGQRTGVSGVDRLTIIAHDRFQEIIDDAQRPDSPLHGVLTTVVMGKDGSGAGQLEKFPVRSVLDHAIEDGDSGSATPLPVGHRNAQAAHPVFGNNAEREVARKTLEIMKGYETLPRSADILEPANLGRLQREVKSSYVAGTLPGTGVDVDHIVQQLVELYTQKTIDIPRILIVPKGEVTTGFHDFDLDLASVHLQPVPEHILIEHLRTHERKFLGSEDGFGRGLRPEDILVQVLRDFTDILYDDDAELLYKLSNQLIEHLRSYLADEGEVENVLQYNQRSLAELIHNQMQEHHWENATAYEAVVSRGFRQPRENAYGVTPGTIPLDFRAPVDDRQYIRGMLFSGFQRCIYPVQRFDSDAERRFAVILESEPDKGLKWLKPAAGDFRIQYRYDASYEPDFVVETSTEKLLCESKRTSDIHDSEVQAKAQAAVAWCQHATRHEIAHGGKSWSYLLIPHDAIAANVSLAGLQSNCRVQAGRIDESSMLHSTREYHRK